MRKLWFSIQYGFFCGVNAWKHWPNTILIDMHLPNIYSEEIANEMFNAAQSTFLYMTKEVEIGKY